MKKNRLIALGGTLLFHLLVLLFLWLYTLSTPPKEEEGGVPVMLGNTSEAAGEADPYELTEVEVASQPAVSPAPPISQPETPLLTQEDEPSLQVRKQPETKPVRKEQKEVKTQAKKTAPVRTTEPPRKTAEELAAEKAAGQIARAFGKGSQLGSRGTAAEGSGTQGSLQGNSSQGKTSGIGGYGTFDLNGRSLGSGSLPVPVYNVQDEGRVVVTIVVNPEGRVIRTSINKRTNTTNPALRRAAEEAAQRARFNSIDGVNDQTGTITYYFRLR